MFAFIRSTQGLGGEKMLDEQNHLCLAPNVFRESHKEGKMGCRNVVHETGHSLKSEYMREKRSLGLRRIYRSQLQPTSEMYEGWNFNSGNYLFTTDTK